MEREVGEVSHSMVTTEREVREGSHSMATMEKMRMKKGKILRVKYEKVKQRS